MTDEQLGTFNQGIKIVNDAIRKASADIPVIDSFVQQAQKIFIDWFEAGRVDGATNHSPSLGYLWSKIESLVGRKATAKETLDISLQLGHSIEGTGRDMEFEGRPQAEHSAEIAQRKHGEDWQFWVAEQPNCKFKVRGKGSVEKKVIQDENGEEQ